MAFVGHGEFDGQNFFVLPFNAELEPVRPRTVVNLVQQIAELQLSHSKVDGFVALIDACYSGEAAAAAARLLLGGLKYDLRYEVLAASADRTAADGCFTRTVTSIVQDGLPGAASETLRLEQLGAIVRDSCSGQVPQHALWNPDPGLFLSWNVQLSDSAARLAKTPTMRTVEELTEWLQPTEQLRRLTALSRASRTVAVVGEAGSGKSALAAALARPEVTNGVVPADFAQASVFVSSTSEEGTLADEIAAQLQRSVAGFPAAAGAVEEQTPEATLLTLGAFERRISRPLMMLPEKQVRIVVDGLDQLEGQLGVGVIDGLNSIATEPLLTHVRLVVTARPMTPLPEGSVELAVHAPTFVELQRYLLRRGILVEPSAQIAGRTDGNWLVVKLLADLAGREDVDMSSLPTGRLAIYDSVLADACQNGGSVWERELRPVLGPLAAAGVGPVLPLALLCEASRRLNGPERPAGVRNALVRLRSLVARGQPGTEHEQLGLFHGTFTDYLVEQVGNDYAVDLPRAHQALAQAIAVLAPMSEHTSTDPLHRYAAQAEPEHAWAIGDYARALASLTARASPIPRQNLSRWQTLYERAQAQLGPKDPWTLTIRGGIAGWTGECGDFQGALSLFEELLPDRERVLGSDHPDTLGTRGNLGAWTGECGDSQGALSLFEELLPDQERVLGPDHHDTLIARSNIATWTGECGDAVRALSLFEELLPDQERVLGPDHPDTLITRNNIAGWTGHDRDAARALSLFEELLPDRERVLGPDHPSTLITRSNIAGFTGQCGDSARALSLFEELLPDRERVLGPDHPDTLVTRSNIAAWTGECGDSQRALSLFEELLPDQQRVLGPDHPDTLITRNNIAAFTGQCGDSQRALSLFEELLPVLRRVLGPGHPKTLMVVATMRSLRDDDRRAD